WQNDASGGCIFLFDDYIRVISPGYKKPPDGCDNRQKRRTYPGENSPALTECGFSLDITGGVYW
ncbi:hypothetical protein AYC70_23910, partial [Salmonella enterica]|nr:hypothetical protein [Salmonella enterica]